MPYPRGRGEADDGRMPPLLCTPPSTVTLEIVVRELDALAVRLDDLIARTRTLGERTDWQAEAAREFHTAATAWAGRVGALACTLAQVRFSAGAALQLQRWRAESDCA